MDQTVLLKEYADYLYNKSVCLVGRAGYLCKRRDGALIDSHDIVVRINDPIPYVIEEGFTEVPREYRRKVGSEWKMDAENFILPKYQSHIGKRCEVWYSVWNGPARKKQVMDCFQVNGGKYYMALRGKTPGEEREKLVENFDGIIFLPELQQGYRKAGHKSVPFGGTVACMHLCEYDIKSLYLTGFTCHVGRPQVWVHGHSGDNDFQWMRNLVKTDERVTVDPVMKISFETVYV